MSPIAYTPGTLVCSVASTVTNPRSSATPTSSYPRPEVFGPRPTATSSTSASITSPPATVTCTPDSVSATDSNAVPVLKAIFRFRNARSSVLLQSASSAGTSRGRASTMVTLVPNEVQAEANSTPITPPPRTTADSGTRSMVNACSLAITRWPSSSRPGSEREYEPDARMTLRPV